MQGARHDPGGGGLGAGIFHLINAGAALPEGDCGRGSCLLLPCGEQRALAAAAAAAARILGQGQLQRGVRRDAAGDQTEGRWPHRTQNR